MNSVYPFPPADIECVRSSTYRSITLPLVMDSRGHVAPPTVWPSGLALSPPGHRSGREATATIGALWLPGWGTFLSSSAAGGASKSAGIVTVAGKSLIGGAGQGWLEDEDERWRWLGVLTAMSAHTEDSTPFLRLGGSPHTDMSGIFHEVSRAGQRGRANSFSSNLGGAPTSSTASGATSKGTLWRGQQKALVEAALEEGVRMVHVPGLEGSATAGTGTGAGSGGGSSAGGGGGGSGGSGASWPGPAGYSFMCWMRFNPPEPGSGVSTNPPASGARGDTPFEGGPPEAMKAWGADAERAAALAAAVAAASAFPTVTAVPIATAGVASDANGLLAAVLPAGAELEDNGELPPVAKSPVLGSLGSPDRGAATVVGEKAAADWIANATKVERRTSTGSVDSGHGWRATEEDESVPRPHLPGRRVSFWRGLFFVGVGFGFFLQSTKKKEYRGASRCTYHLPVHPSLPSRTHSSCLKDRLRMAREARRRPPPPTPHSLLFAPSRPPPPPLYRGRCCGCLR